MLDSAALNPTGTGGSTPHVRVYAAVAFDAGSTDPTLSLRRAEDSGIPIGGPLASVSLTGTQDADEALTALGWARVGPWHVDGTGVRADVITSTPAQHPHHRATAS